MTTRHFALSTAILLVGIAGLNSHLSAQGGRVMVTTHVKNGVVTGWNCGCPKDGANNARVWDIMKATSKMNARQLAELDRLTAAFEAANGVRINSKTNVRNFKTESDKIGSATTGPFSGAGKALCDFLRSTGI
jgi:hypothetical protein